MKCPSRLRFLTLATTLALASCGREQPISPDTGANTYVGRPSFQRYMEGGGGGGGGCCGVSLYQVSDESPLPRYTLCVNAQNQYKDLDLKVDIQDPTLTADLIAAGVVFGDGSVVWPEANDGDVVSVRVSPDGSTGTRGVTAIASNGALADVSIMVFKFQPVLSNWNNIHGTVKIPGVSQAVSTPSNNVTNIQIATSGVGGGGDLGFETSTQNDGTAELSVSTDPAGVFNGEVKVDVSVEHLTIYGGMLVDTYINNGSTGSVGLSVGPFSFSYDFGTDGVGFMGQTGLNVNGVASYGARHEVMSAGLPTGFFSLGQTTLATLVTSGNAMGKWIVGGAGTTKLPVRAAILCVVKKHGPNDRIEDGTALSRVDAFVYTPYEIQ